MISLLLSHDDDHWNLITDNVNLLQHALKLEQEEYSNEGIDWNYIEYIDNQDVLELIEKVKIIVFFTTIVLKRDINLLVGRNSWC